MVKLHIKITATSNAMNIQSCNWLALPDAFSASRSWSLNIVIIVIFKLLLGGSAFHNGESVFKFHPKYCQRKDYFVQAIKQAIILYKIARQISY